MTEHNGFEKYQEKILDYLERFNQSEVETRRELTEIRQMIAKMDTKFTGHFSSLSMELKVKAGMWGAAGAAIPVIAMALWFLIERN
jgi:hypothetical protein